MVRALSKLLSVPLLAALSGCAGLYFHDAGPPPSPPPRYSPEQWPYKEYWAGIVFNGAKIGFSRLAVAPAPGAPGRYEVRSEAAFVLRFLGVEKKFRFQSTDRVNGDLGLERFDYDFSVDGNDMKLTGEVADHTLRVVAFTKGNRVEQEFPLTEPVYPTSVIPLYPVLRGLDVGRRYAYLVYDGQTLTTARAEQEVQAYQTSDLFSGAAYKVKTRLHGQASTTWIDAEGKPLLEIALNGVLISALETEQQARRYLIAASLNKQDIMLDFSIVRPDRGIPEPRALAYLKIEIEGLSLPLPPAGGGQRCARADNVTTCEIRRVPPPPAVSGTRDSPQHDRYLRPTLTAPSIDPRIRTQARQIAGDAADPLEIVNRLVAWIQANIQKSPVDVFSALDVLESKKAECQGHAYLYTAFARALGIPTRIVNGLAYSEELQGFLYHSWTESLIGGTWLPVDPTFGQIGVDATHIKLLEGEGSAELMPLVEVVGKIKARVLSLEE